MNSDGFDQIRLTLNSRNDARPDISPNGQKIVFVSNRITEANPSGDFEIFVMSSDGDGGGVWQLTFNGAEDSWPRWSPNGKWIAFHSNVDGDFEIYVIRPDGTDLTRVTDYPGLDQYPEWSPNGKQLAIRRDTDLYLIDLDGSNPIQLTDEAIGFNQMASWSPDGKMLAFLSTRAGYPSVFVMDIDGSHQVNLTPKPRCSCECVEQPGARLVAKWAIHLLHRSPPRGERERKHLRDERRWNWGNTTNVHDCARSQCRSGGAVTPAESTAFWSRLGGEITSTAFRLTCSSGARRRVKKLQTP